MSDSVSSLEQPSKKPAMDWAHERMSSVFAPVARALHRRNVNPNAVTIAGAVVALSSSVFLATGRWKLAATLIVIAGFMDGIDGLLARQSQRTSRLGAFLDSVLDRWSDVSFFLGLMIWYLNTGMQTQVILAGGALASSLLVSYTRARAEGIGAKCGRGIFTRLERVTLLVVGLVLNVMSLSLWVIVILSTFTAVQRLYLTFQYVRDHPEE